MCVSYRSRFHVFILWLGFFSFFFFFLYLVTNKQTNKDRRKRWWRRSSSKKHIRRLRLWVTKLTVECCLVWYCKHIHFNNFYERLHDDLNAPDFVLHISYIIKIVTKKGNSWHYAIGCVASKQTHTHTYCLTFLSIQSCNLFNYSDTCQLSCSSGCFENEFKIILLSW